ncbi:SEL1-like repeat protein [Inquilinus sp. Marseille-Q2685]|uniref:SEL1-like repeat protein n=1 Tax=Inquilinus sp. Marseille-Q2685 TaxID=2866581 RepID=UPI001CE45E2C|nr:SEL1-like repeat protein [Inquilinus sp. Marseille-Q2685]
MISPADNGIRLDRAPNGARFMVAVLLISAGSGCFAAEGLGARRAEAGSLAAGGEEPQVFALAPTPAAAAQQTSPAAPACVPAAASPPGTGAAAAPANSRAAELLLPDTASAELRSLARRAIAGEADAEHDLGTFYALGIEVPRNFERAACWYRRSADQGVASAAYNLGVLLARGVGLSRDPEAAVARFREAAKAGHAGALNALGLAYRDGSGVARDPAEALIWFRRASLGGNPRGAYNTARLYESGDLGTPDPQAAAGWYRVAADAGDEQAAAALARLQAAAYGDGPAAPRIGFVSLAPESGLLILDQTIMPAAGADPILDDLAAQMAGRPPPDPAELVPASAPAARPAARPRRATVAEIKEIQQLMARLSFDVGPIDGLVGRRTRAAIARFQRGQGLPVTRRASVELLDALRVATLLASKD